MANSGEQAAAQAGDAEAAERTAQDAGELSPGQGSNQPSAQQQPKPAPRASGGGGGGGGGYVAPRSQPSYSNPAAANLGAVSRAASPLIKDALIVGIGLVVGLYAVIEGPKLWKKVTQKGAEKK